ncbi:MAG: DUF421 domain-containing protein [Ruminococcus sp.]|nr:DUF421 domain-containing protein [Ruminococcus sp.]
MSIMLIRTFLLYIIILFSVRFMGKRQMGELQPSELVITILISNIVTQPIENENIPILMGILPILALISFEVIISAISMKSGKFRQIITGRPKVIICNGHIDQKTLKELRFSAEDMLASLRGNDIFSLEDVDYAIVETTGSVSVYKKSDSQQNEMQTAVVIDGKYRTTELEFIGKSKKWAESILNKKNLQVKNIYLMMANTKGEYDIIKKEENGESNDKIKN